jgi:hypothetical protein
MLLVRRVLPKIALPLATSLLIVLGLYVVFYFRVSAFKDEHPISREGRDYPTIRHLESVTMRRVGSLRTDKKSSFVNYEKRKPPGGVRVGVFGDSHSFGDEVNDVYDYPSLLQGLFRSAGYDHVQVINFASSWHGFHQTAILWSELGSQFDLDFGLLGPVSFQPIRDLYFNHTRERQPYYTHSRYVLSGDSIKLIDIFGENKQETFDNHNAFLPSLNVLRFDRRPPALLTRLLPSGRQYPNPFYYYNGSEQLEHAELTARLLQKMADSGVQLILGHYNPRIVELADAVDRSNLFATLFRRQMRFPHIAPRGHHSPFGNLLTAYHFFDVLTGARESRIPVAVFTPVEEPADTLPFHGDVQEHNNDEIVFELQGMVIGELHAANQDQRGDEGWKGAKSLLAFDQSQSGMSLLDSAFLALPQPLTHDAEVRLRITSGAGRSEHLVGHVRLLHSALNAGVVRIEGARVTPGAHGEHHLVIRLDESSNTGTRAELLLDNEVVMTGLWNQKRVGFPMVPTHHVLLAPRARGDALVEKIQDDNQVQMVFRTAQREIRVPIALARFEFARHSLPNLPKKLVSRPNR